MGNHKRTNITICEHHSEFTQLILKYKEAVNKRQRSCSTGTLQVGDINKSLRGKHLTSGSLRLKSNELPYVLVDGPDMGGMFSKYPSDAGRNANNELSINDNDSSS